MQCQVRRAETRTMHDSAYFVWCVWRLLQASEAARFKACTAAAVTIQARVRGWLVRQRIKAAQQAARYAHQSYWPQHSHTHACSTKPI